MKESISYTFLLNIVIIFIFTCAAIIMGILSYYKAFRANTIISNSIEKYEGYNCLSKEEITTKLNGLGYNTPFKVSCKNSDGKCDDSGYSYKVTAYNLDFEGKLVYSKENGVSQDEQMNSTYKCEKDASGHTSKCTTNKHYQYGIYTYMYVELPVVSKLIRIPVFSKTSILYDYKNFYIDTKGDTVRITDVEQIFDKMYDRTVTDKKLYVSDAYYGKESNYTGETRTDLTVTDILVDKVSAIYVSKQTGGTVTESSFMDLTKTGKESYKNRLIFEMIKARSNGKLNAVTSAYLLNGVNGKERLTCGYQFDYSKIND